MLLSTLREKDRILKGMFQMYCFLFELWGNGAETNCRIAHILGILLMNSCNTDIFFSNYYHLLSVRFELKLINYKYRLLRAKLGLRMSACYCFYFYYYHYSYLSRY